MELKVYNQKAEEVGKVKLSESVFGLPWNPDLVHQVMTSLQANKRKGTAHAKTRAEVRGGGRKPWRQKGTGRARHGSIRSPLWRGGGATFGPTKERNYFKKINKKMKRKALLVALSQKTRDSEIMVVDELHISAPKTKEAATIIKALSRIKGFEKMAGKKKNSLFLLAEKSEKINRGFHNLPNASAIETRNLNLLDILNYKHLIFTKDAINTFKSTSK